MHKDDFLATRKYQVGRARQVSPVQPVPISHAVHKTAHVELGLGVLGADATHQVAALIWCERVDHGFRGAVRESYTEIGGESTPRMDISPPLKRFSPSSV